LCVGLKNKSDTRKATGNVWGSCRSITKKDSDRTSIISQFWCSFPFTSQREWGQGRGEVKSRKGGAKKKEKVKSSAGISTELQRIFLAPRFSRVWRVAARHPRVLQV
jgi:hypothetical protein